MFPRTRTLATLVALAAAATLWLSSAAPAMAAASAIGDGPKVAFLLECPSARAKLVKELGVTAAQLKAANAIAVALDLSQVRMLRDSNVRMSTMATGSAAARAEVTNYNAALDKSENDALPKVAAAFGKPEAEVRAAMQTAWAEQVVRAQEAAQYNQVNSALGVKSYRILATSFRRGHRTQRLRGRRATRQVREVRVARLAHQHPHPVPEGVPGQHLRGLGRGAAVPGARGRERQSLGLRTMESG